MTDTVSAWQGNRLVLVLYAILVALSGAFGFALGVIQPVALEPRLFMLVDLPPTPLGMAIYGSVTVAAILGVLLLAVRYVAREYDTADRPG